MKLVQFNGDEADYGGPRSSILKAFEQAKPSEDIKHFIQTEFEKIKPNYGQVHVLPPEKSTKELLRELFLEIEHGDQEHRDWLKNKIEDFIIKKGL